MITLKQLQRHEKPIIIYNDNGFYDSLLELIQNSVEMRFMSPMVKNLYSVAGSIDEVLSQLADYVPFTYRKYE